MYYSYVLASMQSIFLPSRHIVTNISKVKPSNFLQEVEVDDDDDDDDDDASKEDVEKAEAAAEEEAGAS